MFVCLFVCLSAIRFISVYFREATDSMQYLPPNVNLDSCCQIVYIVTGDNVCSQFSVVTHNVVSIYPYGMLYSVQLGNMVIIYNEVYTIFSCD